MAIKWLPVTFCYIHSWVLCSEKLPPAGDGSKYRDLQLENMQRVRDLRIPSPKWCVFIKFLPLELRELWRGWENIVSSVETEDISEAVPSRYNRASAHGNIQRLWQHATAWADPSQKGSQHREVEWTPAPVCNPEAISNWWPLLNCFSPMALWAAPGLSADGQHKTNIMVLFFFPERGLRRCASGHCVFNWNTLFL